MLYAYDIFIIRTHVSNTTRRQTPTHISHTHTVSIRSTCIEPYTHVYAQRRHVFNTNMHLTCTISPRKNGNKETLEMI